MKFGSICSGIEAASTAWHSIGWETAYVAEIEPFPAAVLATRFGAGRPIYMPSAEDVEFPAGFDRDDKALATRLRFLEEWNKASFEEQCFLRAFDLRAHRTAAIKALDSVKWGNAVPNYGDFTRIADEPDAPDIDLLVGGTPCQAFSFAGLRLSLADARGNLTLEFVRLVHASKSLRWAVWENVPGVLSTADNAFGCFLGGLVGSDAPVCVPGGGKWPDAGMVAGPLGRAAWRVLDAQHFGLAQRRRRVFVVFCPATSGGDPSAILFERESMPWDFEAGHEAREGIAGTIASGARKNGGYSCDDIPLTEAFGGNNTGGPIDVATACTAHGGPHGRLDFESETFIAHAPSIARCVATREGSSQDFETTTMIAHTLRGEGFDASEDGTGRSTPLVPVYSVTQDSCPSVNDDIAPALKVGTGLEMGQPPCIAFTANDHGADAGSLAPTLRAGGHKSSHANNGIAHAVAFSENVRGEVRESATSPALTSGGGKPGQGYSAAMTQSGVRRLTPTECERLQGFPDGHTDIQWKGRPAPDGPRYKALGNSMAVTVMAWIGQRIAAFEAGKLNGWRFDWSLVPWVGNYGPGHVATAFALRGREGGAMPEIEGDITGALRAAGGGSSRSYLATEPAE